MSTINTKKVVNVLSILAVVFTAIQGMIPAMPLTDTTAVSAIIMFLVSGTTIWKQALSKEIDSKALVPTIMLAIAASLGGVNELLKLIPFNEITGQWIRFGVTAATALLNILSKTIWPTPETKSII